MLSPSMHPPLRPHPLWCSLRPATLALLLGVFGCRTSVPAPRPAAEPFTSITEDLRIQPLAPGVWRLVALSGEEWGHIPANGLVIAEGGGVLLVDPGWTEAQGERLLQWVEDTLKVPVHAGVATHFHADRTGGLRALQARGIPTHALALTAALTSQQDRPAPTHLFPGPAQQLGPVELFFPGPGHAPDNITVWHAASGILFGGCMVKDLKASSLGNLSDADLASWPRSVESLQARYPAARTVIPGHGEPGDTSLLAHTLELLRAGSR
ncbi:Metallo-beta-lactamase family protein [Stigmatella aurantiaca DW4/3-1]|nr:Metallo-beta-lactamase family protein [Stigmatella aurantiaca DW4/3-1]